MPSITSWTRLEPRARNGEMRPGLEARVHDPLWLLGRQWQLGECQGEDVGSPVWARLRVEVAPFDAVQVPGGGAEKYDPTVPLQTMIERDPAPPTDLRTAAEAGLQFLRLLDGDLKKYRDPFRAAFPLVPPTGAMDTAGARYLAIMASRAPDGMTLATALRNGLPANPPVAPEHLAGVKAAADRFLTWFDKTLRNAPTGTAAWQAERFEYTFQVSAHSEGADVVLRAPEHQGGSLDWHSFVHDTTTKPPSTTAAKPEVIVSTTLAAPARYAGMPAPRYWEIEDSKVDFGGVDAAPTDLARMLVLNFATIFGNDWYVIPIQLPVGTLTHVRSLVVGDTFGGLWSIPAPPAEEGWSMFQPTAMVPNPDGSTRPNGWLDRLVLPPSPASGLESEPVEDVLMLRDEDANIAWAVEQTVEGIAGNRTDRVEAWHEQLRRHGDAAAHVGAGEKIAALAYRLRSEVPEHWIPLIAEEIKVTAGIKSGRTNLRVSPLPRPGEGQTTIQPLGRILKQDLLVPEEEVPGEGARVTRTWRYARWTNGSAHLWTVRRKRPGRGPGTSGLGFDLVEPWQPSKDLLAYDHISLQTSIPPTNKPTSLNHLQAGQTALVSWRIRNTGTETWQRTGPDAFQLGTSDDRDHPGRLVAPNWLDSTRPAALAEPTVRPGETGTFIFEIRAPTDVGAFEEAYEPTVKGTSRGQGWAAGTGLHLTGSVIGP